METKLSSKSKSPRSRRRRPPESRSGSSPQKFSSEQRYICRAIPSHSDPWSNKTCHNCNPRRKSEERWLTGPTTKKQALHGLLRYVTERKVLTMGLVLPQLKCHPTTPHRPPPPMRCTPTPTPKTCPIPHTPLPCLPRTELHPPQHPDNDIDIPPPSHPPSTTNCTCLNWCRPSSSHP